MRDSLKDKTYFTEFIEKKERLISRGHSLLDQGKVAVEMIDTFKFDIFDKSLSKVIADYSIGLDLVIVKDNYLKILSDLNVWKAKTTKVNLGIQYTDRYTVEPHGKMLRMLSLGYLLNTSDQDFKILVDKIDRDNISDNLYEFIIKARFPDRVQKRPEEYDTDQSVILKVYDKLRRATEQNDKEEAAKLVKEFLEKDFYHKHSGFYNSHKSKANTYYGYWSFEAAAIVKIMGLDDSSFIDQQYYPKDLVHQSPEPPKKKGLLGKLGF
ncbi:PoNe immunity protein domain-containing protein [Aquimarina sp. MMG016]|uniref:PoNe immunity protein domain-containing protein n=1 Tax=Aquimarina sp. MMG016 TaxID=2822690 RepID=UPI001B39D9B0|nr:PoNe immunity protein domain-containing protein [Aquimarina sp. MMG016]MBQ4818857.1 DUF1911 domain-containing protein [Aquimarina sp. MMG016]